MSATGYILSPVTKLSRGLNQRPPSWREALLPIAAWALFTALGTSTAGGQTDKSAVSIEVYDSLNQAAPGVHVEVVSSAGLEFCGETAKFGQTAWFGAGPEAALTCTLFPKPLPDGQLLGAVYNFTLPFQEPGYTLHFSQGYCMPRAQQVRVRGAAESFTYFTQANDYPFWSLITPKHSNADFDCSVATLVGPQGIAATARFHGFGDRVAPYRRGAALVSESVALGAGKGGGLVVLIEISEGIEESRAPLVEPTIDVIRCTLAPQEGQPIRQPKLTLIPCPAGPGEVGVALVGELQAGTHFFLVREKDGVPGRLIDVLDQAPNPLPQPPPVPTPPAPSAGNGCADAVDCEHNMPRQPAEPGDGPCPPVGPKPKRGCQLSVPVLVSGEVIARPITESLCGTNGAVCKSQKAQRHTFSLSRGNQTTWSQEKYEFSTESDHLDQAPYQGLEANSCGLCLRWYAGGHTYRYRWDRTRDRLGFTLLWPDDPLVLPSITTQIVPGGISEVILQDSTCGEFVTVGICDRFPAPS